MSLPIGAGLALFGNILNNNTNSNNQYTDIFKDVSTKNDIDRSLYSTNFNSDIVQSSKSTLYNTIADSTIKSKQISNPDNYYVNNIWRIQNDSINRIKKLKPDFVVISTFSHYNLYDKNSQKENYYVSGQRDLFNKLSDYSQNLIYLSDTPKPEKDIPNCLSTNPLSSCNEIKRSSNKVYEGFLKIDPYQWFCKDGCDAINNEYVVYRDASHISIAAAIAATDELRNSLVKAGLLN